MRTSLFGVLSLALVSQALCAQEIQGTWQLMQIDFRNALDSNPKGIPTRKEYYSADGRVYFISAEGTKDDAIASFAYKIDGATATVVDSKGRPHVATVKFADPDTLIVTAADGTRSRYQRLSGEDAPNRKLEPMSVEVLNPDGHETTPPHYDSHDYSRMPPKKRIVGVWEAIAYRNVKRDAAPPYGFFNDLWTFDPSSLSLIVRCEGNNPTPRKLHYSVKGDQLELQGRDAPIAVSFDSWGHLVLGLGDQTIVLKLLRQDTARQIEPPPLKVTLLSFDGEP